MENRIYDIKSLVGNTPLVRLERTERENGLRAKLYGKLERCNPGGSIKDRVGFAMLEDALARGVIKPGATVIEPTSGSTGIGLAIAAVQMGMKAIIVMPDTMSVERRALLAAYGAQLVLTPGDRGMSGAIEEADRIAKDTENSFVPMQFSNPSNADAHYKTTAPEICEALGGAPDVLVAGVGTGGTVTGCGRYMKEHGNTYVAAVEPFESQVLATGVAGPHGIQGIGANFVPDVYDNSVVDEIMAVKTNDAIEMMKRLAATEGHLCGISSGAALCAAIELAGRQENEGRTVVAILPDSGERYLSVISGK